MLLPFCYLRPAAVISDVGLDSIPDKEKNGTRPLTYLFQSPQNSFIFCRPSLQNLRSDKVVWDCENGTCLHHSILDSVPFKSRNRLTLNATIESDDLDIAHLRELKSSLAEANNPRCFV